MLRIGINGFGRIGRAVFRVNSQQKLFDVVAINDIDPNVENHAYLLKYDSHYGRFDKTAVGSNEEMTMAVDGQKVNFYAKNDIADVPWQDHGVDVVIDSSGIYQNVCSARNLVDSERVKKVVVTHAPKDGVDFTLVCGVNEAQYDFAEHSVISASICDVISSAVVLNVIDNACGIRSGFITTLHPWLSYQNVSDGTVRSVSSPGHFWDDFALGRASASNLIPKKTTLKKALSAVIPNVSDRISAMSFRVPTGVVTASDLVLELKNPTTTEEINNLLRNASVEHPRVLGYQEDQLVSTDFLGIEQSVFVDGRWTMVAEETSLRLVLWYDNEWGYSQRVADVAAIVGSSPREIS